MESAATGDPAGNRSLVVPEGAVRLVTRGDEARFQALTACGERVLEAIARARPEGRYRSRDATFDLACAPGLGRDSADDLARLCSPSILDTARLLAGCVVDEPGPVDATVPPAGIYGAFSYELVDTWEALPPRAPDPWNEPDINVVFALDTVVFDHQAGTVSVVTRAIEATDPRLAEERHRRWLDLLEQGDGDRSEDTYPETVSVPVPEKEAVSDVADDLYREGVRKFLRHIERGDIFQGVLSRALTMKSEASPLTVYRALRRRNPSPYMFHLDVGNGCLLGASPETCIKVEDARLEIRPIAGTAPRGFGPDGVLDEELDSRLAVGLLLDAKEQAEHAMLVDLARNDVARVCVPGTRRVASPFTIEKYSHVQHLVSGVEGRLLPELDALHAYRAAANMGTLTGAPKLRAMELIRETEPTARGFYGGAVGYFLGDGTFDSCIVIRSLRSATATATGGRGETGLYQTRVGAGIVAESVPERELLETTQKARATRVAVSLAEKWSS
jgi:anthranilate synthase component 1